MDANGITAMFKVAIPTINQHIALAQSSQSSYVGNRHPALRYVHFEIETDRVHIVTTDGKALLHTEVQLVDGCAKEPTAFDVRAMPRITPGNAAMTTNPPAALFVVEDGLISTGDIVARIAVDINYPLWRNTLPSRERMERETAWRPLDPEYYALAQKFAGCGDYADAHRVKGQTGGPVVFYKKAVDENEQNIAVVMPLRVP